jgi:hypothetical protein
LKFLAEMQEKTAKTLSTFSLSRKINNPSPAGYPPPHPLPDPDVDAQQIAAGYTIQRS